MHTIEIPEGHLIFYFPQSLSECDSQQYMDMCELIYRYQSGQLFYDDLKAQAVYKLLNLKLSKKQLLVVDEEAKWGNIYQIAQLVDEFFEDKDGSKVIKMDFSHNPVPCFKPLWRTYHGPADTFLNCTFGEYIDSLRLFLDFSATGNPALLNDLAATLYRPAKPFHTILKRLPTYNGDIRQRYNVHLLDDRARVFKSAPIGFIYGVFLMFASFQKYLTTAEIQWGGQVIDFSILFDSGTSENQLEAVPGIGMDSLAFALAESGRFGDLEGVRRANLWEVLALMYDLRKKDLDYKLNDKSNAKN